MATQQTHTNSIPLSDLEAGPPALSGGEAERPPSPPPEYKAEDMEEPLPPYMARVKMVMRGEQPMGIVMPEKRAGFCLLVSFLVIVVVVIGASVGVSIRNNNDNNNNNVNN